MARPNVVKLVGVDSKNGEIIAVYISHELSGYKGKFVPDRPHGEWIETSNIWETEDLSGWGYWKECSSCHCQEKRRTSFCPNCGSDNRPKIHGCSFADETCKNNPCADCGLREGESE